MKRFWCALLVMACVLASAGCSTLADAKAAKGTGSVRVYSQPYDLVWDGVVQSVQASGLALVSANQTEGVVLAQGAMGAFTYGENVAIYVEKVGGQIKTRVEVINKRVLATNITAFDWEGRLTSAIDQRMAALPKP